VFGATGTSARTVLVTPSGSTNSKSRSLTKTDAASISVRSLFDQRPDLDRWGNCQHSLTDAVPIRVGIARVPHAVASGPAGCYADARTVIQAIFHRIASSSERAITCGQKPCKGKFA
jgi:hypothetical protein